MALLNLFRTESSPQLDYSMEQLLDSLEDVVLTVTQGDCLQYVNRCWETLTGVSKKDSSGRPLTAFLHPEDIHNWRMAVQEVTATRQSQMIWIRISGPGPDR